MSVPELSVQIRNAPGQLVQVTTILAEAGVNVQGVTASSAGKTGWVHMVVDKAKLAEEALQECGISVETGEALAIMMPDEPGALDCALRLLSDRRINVDYIYTCLTGSKGKGMAILGVQSPGKVEKIFRENGIELWNEAT
ncbi:MAG: ACT domain-containing protein [bacterium]|nr:ACT domain-containing protein [Candidatus Sumerlaeota bacterium]